MTKEELILNNQALVPYMIKKLNLFYIYDEVYDLGLIGLVKAANTFDSNKCAFANYACTCIRNEILMYLRKKQPLTVSINTPTTDDLTLEDMLSDNYDFTNDLEELDNIQNALKILSIKERDMIIKYFGLFGSKIYKQKELGELYNHSQAYINRLINRALNKLRKEVLK